MKIEVLSTKRLALRKITPEVMDFAFTTYSDEELSLFLGTSNADDLEKEKEKWRKGLSTHNKSFLYFQLLDNSDNALIGWCGYHTWYLDHERAEIGYGLFDDQFKRKGLMSEAIAFILDYGFTEMNLNRVEAFTAQYNDASIQLLSKFGFEFEGELKGHYFWKGTYEDSLLYSLLKSNHKIKM